MSDMPARTVIAIIWLLAIYVAVALRSALADTLPIAFPAIVAASAIGRCAPHSAILWSALVGLACDATGQGRLGPHLACYALIAAIGVRLPDAQRRSAPAMTLFAALLATSVELLMPALSHVAMDIAPVVQLALCTALVVLTVEAMRWCTVRLIRPMHTTHAPRLSNRWTMLTE